MSDAPSATMKCAMCGETFDAAWSDDEDATEAAANFPGMTVGVDTVVVCDPCFQLSGGPEMHIILKFPDGTRERLCRAARDLDGAEVVTNMYATNCDACAERIPSRG